MHSYNHSLTMNCQNGSHCDTIHIVDCSTPIGATVRILYIVYSETTEHPYIGLVPVHRVLGCVCGGVGSNDHCIVEAPQYIVLGVCCCLTTKGDIMSVDNSLVPWCLDKSGWT